MSELVMNTGPVIALTAAVGSLEFLEQLYSLIQVPREVYSELAVFGMHCPELVALEACRVVRVASHEVELPKLLRSQLDKGEASVNQSALIAGINTVVIDEQVGRRIARLHGLSVTGSLGLLIKGVREGLVPDLSGCFEKMSEKGIWISEELKQRALHAAHS